MHFVACMSSTSNFIIRAPRGDEMWRAEKFLPHPFFDAPQQTQWLAMFAEPFERIIGAAMWLAQEDRVARFQWRIVPRFRDGDHANQFLEQIIGHARGAGARSLQVAGVVNEGGSEERALRETGFVATSVEDVFEAENETVSRRFDALYKTVSARVPAGVRVVALTPEFAPAVCALAMREQLVSAQLFEAKVRAPDGGYVPELSPMLLVDDVVRGALLVSRRDLTVEVEVRVVDASLRASWANLLLLRTQTQWTREVGATTFRFRAGIEAHRETMNFALRCGARKTARQLLFAHDLRA